MSNLMETEYGRRMGRLMLLYAYGHITFRTYIILACTVYTEFNPTFAEAEGAS